jgi:hypothetical protein
MQRPELLHEGFWNQAIWLGRHVPGERAALLDDVLGE